MALFPISGNNKQSERNNTGELEAANFKIMQLEKKLSDLSFMLDALWEIVREQTQLDANTLSEKVSAKKNELEARTNETATCSSCNRTVPASKESCYYCGAKLA